MFIRDKDGYEDEALLHSNSYQGDFVGPLVDVLPHVVGQVDLGDLDVGVGAPDDVGLVLGGDLGELVLAWKKDKHSSSNDQQPFKHQSKYWESKFGI